ncbi:sulfurtransferase-like selenium metabolism protein YedF [Sebaldella termitidis]|uniref:sulfurtransferase-like selenium metabolism protein YedF n=1 Tax=Sebaldella termitidis TaxID=826 RepID=UPI003EC02EA7
MKLDSGEVLAIASNKMGHGDDKLGKILIKSFIHVLTESEKVAGTIVFYNSGVLLAENDSACLDDLKLLEKNGVEILLCGTCADYYNISDKISAGKISNMRVIVEKLENAGKIIKP